MWVKGQASASYDYGKTQETNEERSTQTIISKATPLVDSVARPVEAARPPPPQPPAAAGS